jgi:uroporphyrin-3 C-methyltransferase
MQDATLQRTQLEELMHNVSRSRDENLLIDLESALRMAQQQAQLSAAWSRWWPPSRLGPACGTHGPAAPGPGAARHRQDLERLSRA